MSEVFEEYFNGSYSYSWLVGRYRNLTQAFLNASLQHQPLVYNQTTNLTVPLQTATTLTSAILLLDWNASSFFTVDVFLQNTLHINRRVAFASGMVLASLGVLLLPFALPQVIPHSNQKRPEEA